MSRKQAEGPSPTSIAMARMTLQTSRKTVKLLKLTSDPYLDYYTSRLLWAAEIIAQAEGGDAHDILHRELEF